MLVKDTLFILILIIAFLRGVVMRFRGNYNTDFLFVSLFVIAAPFNFDWKLKVLTQNVTIRGKQELAALGTFGNSINVNFCLIIIILLLIFGRYKLNSNFFDLKRNKWLYVFLVFCLISFINPLNIFPLGVFPLMFYVLQVILLFKFFEANFDKQTLLKGVFDGMVVLSILLVSLAVAFPILKIKEATTLFYGETSLLNAMRREGYPSAVGIFAHPNSLGFFMVFPIAFFVSCYLNKFGNKSLILILLLSNALVCFLTFSRASYIGIGASLVFVIGLFQYKTKILSSKQIFTLVGVCVLIFGGAYFYLTAYQNLLLFKDANSMLEVREKHWTLGYEIWKQSKIIGIGINSHVYYMSHTNFSFSGSLDSFTANVAIHNIHFTVLAETGLIGIAVWLYLFYSKILKLATTAIDNDKPAAIFKMAFLAILICVIVNGIFDVGPFLPHLMYLILFFGYFTYDIRVAKIKTT